MLRRTAKPKALVRSLSLSALSIGAVSVDLDDGAYDGGRRQETFPEWLHDVARVPIFAGATLVAKIFLQGLNRTKVEGTEHLIKELETRPEGTAVITVSNHSATVDDPAVFAKYVTG
jgi:hypothetical protein